MLWLYALVALVTIALAVIAGFRKGMRRQVPSFVATLIATICARLFMPPLSTMLAEAFPFARGTLEAGYIYSLMAASFIFLAVFLIFKLALGLVWRALRIGEGGVLNSIAGAIFKLFLYLMFLSIGYNMLICINPRSVVLKCIDNGDGNIVSEVVTVAPAILGTESPQSLCHRQQLEAARRIS